jgi:hypothetical protein
MCICVCVRARARAPLALELSYCSNFYLHLQPAIQILGDDTNKSDWHSWWNQEQIKFRECFLLVGPKSFVFPSHIKNIKIKIYKTVILPVVLYGCETWSLTLREEHRLRVFENRVLRRIFGPKREEDGSWRKLHNEEFHSLYLHRILLGWLNQGGWGGRDI